VNHRHSSSASQSPMNRPLGFALAGVAALMLGACGQGEPSKGPSGSAGAAAEAQPSLIDRAIGFTKDATNTVTEKATASVTGAAADKVRAVTGSALIRGSGLAEVSTTKAQEWIEQVKSLIGKDRPDLAAGVMDKLRLVKSALPEGLSAEVDRLDVILKDLLKKPPSSTAAVPTPAGH
jgi:hypothetical protein